MSGSELLDHVDALATRQRGGCEAEILRATVQHAVLNGSETLDPRMRGSSPVAPATWRSSRRPTSTPAWPSADGRSRGAGSKSWSDSPDWATTARRHRIKTFGGYLKEDVTFLNNTNELIYLTEDRANGARVVVRARVRGNRVISEAPLLPGAGTDGTAIDVARGNFPRLVRMRDGHRRAYVTTPQRCPPKGSWVTRVRFAYHDGTTQTERTRNRCGR